MTTVEAQTVADLHVSDDAHGDTGQQRGTGGVLPDGRSAAECGGLNRTSASSADISGGGPVRQLGRHRRVPRVQVGRWGAHHAGVAGRHFTTLAGFTRTAIIQLAGLTPRLRRRG